MKKHRSGAGVISYLKELRSPDFLQVDHSFADIKGVMATVYKLSECNTPASWHSKSDNPPKCTSTRSKFSFRSKWDIA